MTSIRRALTVRLLCTIGVMMALVALALFLGVRAALLAEFDATLRARLATLESATRWDGERVDLDYVSEAMPWYQPGPDAEFFEIEGPGENSAPSAVVAKSPSLSPASWDVALNGNDTVSNGRLPNGRPGRIATETFKPPPDESLDESGKEEQKRRAVATTPTVRVTVAMSRARLDAVLRTVGVALVLAAGVMTLGLIVGVRHALARGLAPLQKLSADVEQIGVDTLSARLPRRDLPRELRPMHERLNGLIERLEVAFAREHRFASGAAHELRTPVAELRTLLEVSLSRQRTAEDAHTTIDEALRLTLRMDRLVRSLLALARPAATPAPEQLPRISLLPALAACVQRFEPGALARGGAIERTGGEGCFVNADPDALDSILSNTLANAIEYAQPVPTVRCAIGCDEPGRLTVDITNPVGELTGEQVARFFEPFWRGSESRTDHSHIGLGLTLTSALAQSMGGEVTAELESPRLLRIRVVLFGGSENAPDAHNGRVPGEVTILAHRAGMNASPMTAARPSS